MSVLRDYAAAVSQPTLPLEVPGAGVGNATARYDEVVDRDGGLRPAWQSLAGLALALTPAELGRVEGEITRFLADDGVTYVRPDTGAQPWQLDPMPLVVDAASWARLEAGLAQRAELLGAVLADLYGSQTLLASGVVPAAVVLGHAGFVRPVARGDGGDSGDRHPLLLSATDLGRDADGEWRVLADRVQAPSGLGYAMENRRVLSQVLPDLYQQSDPHRMEPYFSALHATLAASAPAGVDEPRVVVLTPGPHSETAFDQAFLARGLGLPLVQGSDLVVRRGRVWLKPVGWPRREPTEQVDVILRRVDAEWCDPLELRPDSRLGVAGLAEAVRRGTVRLVNGLGAGVLENPGLLPFLPAASEALLGEQLRLTAVPTWWCGDDTGREVVLDRLRSGDPALVVQTIDGSRHDVAGMSPEALAARIAAAPHRFVGQERLPLSQAPVWAGAGAAAQSLVLRAFTLRHGSVYRPLLGGLATVRADAGSAPTTKDVWVLKAAETDPDQGLTEIAPLPGGRSNPSVAPRALADMFWSGRYAERAEDLLRLVITAQQQIDLAGAGRAPQTSARALREAIHRLAGPAPTPVPAASAARSDDADADFRSLLLDPSRTGSTAHALARMRDALEGVRDQLSGDTWRVFAGIERASRALRASPHSHRTAESAGRMLTVILSLQGVTANMMRDAAWHLIEAGRFLERALQVTFLLQTAIERRDARTERSVLEGLLSASESIVTHRRRYRGAVRPADVLDLLLRDPDNPRSVAFALAELRTHLAAAPASTGSTRPERLVEDVEAFVAGVDAADLVAAPDGIRTALADLLAELTAQLEQLGDAIGDLHFESGPPPVALSSLALIEELMEVRA
ncbi:circularly permuted type 2 ATP-grasp protein [Microbacterium radiodurans]|uniref:Circularly permuted type 2 ATP-grasp protein n=1 Tax=Microbacterium radiodurans TaxID=661398 RepID=A0A5J5IXC7_9MICO|nr:circularly permuted type 2 ATP-grasp protein [Microbacterium radiodurans]KAA9089465.1 circularly permuted type 2 ATP-grasp protein [Microbacterium radiodurans]